LSSAALMCGAAIAGVAARPSAKAADRGNAIVLETAVPRGFGEWTELLDQKAQVVNPQTEELLRQLYSQVLSRTYVNKDGYRIMLSMAYGDDQRGGLQAHRPEVCYPAQGFKLGRPRTDRWRPASGRSRCAG
jgi:EpsI family protein